MNYVEEIKKQGLEEGLEKGLEKGREEGIAEGREEGREEGIAEGRLEERVRNVESLLRAGARWPFIESATGVDEAGLRALKQRLPASSAANGAEDAE